MPGPYFMDVKKVIAGISTLYTNADQLLNKMEDLKMMITNEPPDIIIINEVIPKAQRNLILADSLNIDGYDLSCNFKLEEENMGAAGTRGIDIYLLDSLVNSSVDRGHATTVGVEHMYRSPSTNIETSTMAVCNIMSLALNIEHTHFLLVGDFNYKDIDWENEYVYQPGSRENSSESKLLKGPATFMECVHDCLLFNTSRNRPINY